MTAPRPPIRVVAAVIAEGGRYLITQRRPTAVLPLLWEFPGGKVEQGESDADALKREVFHRLGVQIEIASVVGDSVWDMLAARRARALGIGLLSGGYGLEELERAGAYRVYEDPADLLAHLDEVGGRR